MRKNYTFFKDYSHSSCWKLLLVIFLTFFNFHAFSQKVMEPLNRALVAVKTDDGVFLSWRIFATDENTTTSYNLYRNGILVNSTPISGISNYTDSNGSIDSNYYLEVLVNGSATEKSDAVLVWENNYKEIALQTPEDYEPNDCSVADLDGDGELEIVVKMQGTSYDNSQTGYTDPVYLQAYEMNGTLKWSINLGINIRAGAHYTQFMVYDLDGDGKAEVACKTAPGTKDGTGSYLSDGPAADDDNEADYRNTGNGDGRTGYILKGPEYLTVFNGETGAEISTVDYVPGRGTVSDWGDSYGNRVDRFLACVAYLGKENSDGQLLPSLVMCRGYYTRMTLAAWDFDGKDLTQRWLFDTDSTSLFGKDSVNYYYYRGQGAHSLATGDLDGDGLDEIEYGAAAIDNDGVGLYSTGNCHGDATHLGDFIPSRPGLEFWMPSEEAGETNAITGETIPGAYLLDTSSGDTIFTVKISGTADVGRAMTADITADYPGNEYWASSGIDVYNSSGEKISTNTVSINFASWWDGDLIRELLDDTKIKKWKTSGSETLLSASDCASNNSTKATPCLSGDILGDWREEVILRTSDNSKLRIYTTTYPTEYGIYTLLQDPQYREAIAWQNVGYNQPPNTSFFLGANMDTPPTPSIQVHSTSDDPSLEITSPVVGDTIAAGGNVYVSISTNNVGDSKTIFISDEENVLDTLTTAPYIFNLGVLSEGNHNLVAWFLDNSNKVVNSDSILINVDEGLPEISLVSPKDNKIYNTEGIEFSAEASDSDGSIQSVKFYLNDELTDSLTETPFSTTISGLDTGTYEVKAVVTDNTSHEVESNTHTFYVKEGTVIQENETGFCEMIGDDSSIDSNHEDYYGDGFANVANIEGSGITWSIRIPEEDTYKFIWRYAATSDRAGVLYFNDSQQEDTIAFVSSGSWDAWSTDSLETELTSGIYEVTLLATTTSGLPNIDYMQIISNSGGLASAADCDLKTSAVEDDIMNTNTSGNIQIYPIPAVNILNIKTNNSQETIKQVAIYNLSGVQVYNNKFNSNSLSINIAKLHEGIFIIKIKTNFDTYNRKLTIE